MMTLDPYDICVRCTHTRGDHGDDPSMWSCWAKDCHCESFTEGSGATVPYSMTCDLCGFVLSNGGKHLCIQDDRKVISVELTVIRMSPRQALLTEVEAKLGESLVFETMTDEQLQSLADLPWVGQLPNKYPVPRHFDPQGAQVVTNCKRCGHSVDSHPEGGGLGDDGCLALRGEVSGMEQCRCMVKFK